MPILCPPNLPQPSDGSTLHRPAPTYSFDNPCLPNAAAAMPVDYPTTIRDHTVRLTSQTQSFPRHATSCADPITAFPSDGTIPSTTLYMPLHPLRATSLNNPYRDDPQDGSFPLAAYHLGRRAEALPTRSAPPTYQPPPIRATGSSLPSRSSPPAFSLITIAKTGRAEV